MLSWFRSQIGRWWATRPLGSPHSEDRRYQQYVHIRGIKMLISVILILGLASVYFIIRNRDSAPSQSPEPRQTIVVLGVQIICGDCSGDARPSSAIYMNRLADCPQCGEPSYVAATKAARPAQSQIHSGLRSYKRALKDLYI